MPEELKILLDNARDLDRNDDEQQKNKRKFIRNLEKMPDFDKDLKWALTESKAHEGGGLFGVAIDEETDWGLYVEFNSVDYQRKMCCGSRKGHDEYCFVIYAGPDEVIADNIYFPASIASNYM